MRKLQIATFICLFAALIGCAPKVGTDAWCKAIDKKAKGDWTANEMADYAKHCVLGLKPEE